MKNPLFGIVVLVLVVAGGYWALTASNDEIRCTDCNVIIVGFDALQARHVHHLGYDRDTTPTLDSLAANGFSFSQAISPASWTVPSFMSIFTASYPSVHKVVNKFSVFNPPEQHFSNLEELSPNIETLAEVMKRNGYATGGFTGDAGVLGRFGYNQGFDIYTDEAKFGSMGNSATHALTWLDSLPKEQKFFMFFHGYDAHGQFDIPENYTSRYAPEYNGKYKGTEKEQEALREQGLKDGKITLSDEDVEFWRAWYDGKIRDADERLGAFLDELEKRGLLEKTIIIVVSDHGTEFYEHNRFDHGHTLYDELLNVPLIMKIPNVAGGSVIPAQVTTLDVAPTLLDILGITADGGYAEQIAKRTSLVPYLEDPTKAGYDVFSETDYRNFVHKRSVRTMDGWKYVLSLESGEEELYDLRTDPGEKNNILTEARDKATSLREKLWAHLETNLGYKPGDTLRSDCIPVYEGQCL